MTNKRLINFWGKFSKKNLIWDKEPKKVYSYNQNTSGNWFEDGKINACFNCLDNNIKKGLGKKVAIHAINNDGEIKSLTYNELLDNVSCFINFIKKKYKNIKKIKRIMMLSSASIESAVVMLACCRLGITHNIIFEDLEESAILKRIKLFKPNLFIARTNKEKIDNCIKPIISQNKKIPLLYFDKNFYSKKNVTEINLNYIKKKFTNRNTLKSFKSINDIFVLFTSGSTGTPKGVVHSTGGYLTYTKYTCRKFFGYKENSVIFTASDAGWINGHTYSLYGPLMFGATSVLIENPLRLVDEKILHKIINNLKIDILYLPVTLIRILKSLKLKKIKNHKIKTIGSMGEPLAPEISKWYLKFFNPQNKTVVNTYFQTETSGILTAPKFNDNFKYFTHGSVGRPPEIIGLKINKKNNNYVENELTINKPWPGCMSRILNGKEIWKKYFDKYNNFKLFDTGYIDKKFNLIIGGRTDDVVNIRGHRIGSTEVESLLLSLNYIIEACAVGIDDEYEGTVFILFLVIKKKKQNILRDIKKILKNNFGSYSFPKKVFIVKQLPKTKSGKILRRLLRNIYDKKVTLNNDISTINDPNIIKYIKKEISNPNNNLI